MSVTAELSTLIECTELGGTLKTHLYNSTFYSFLQFALTFSPNDSIPLEILHTSSRYVVSDFKRQSTKKNQKNVISGNYISALDSSGHAPLKINILNFHSLSPLFRTIQSSPVQVRDQQSV